MPGFNRISRRRPIIRRNRIELNKSTGESQPEASAARFISSTLVN
jgi:hypothetical protein